MQTLRSQNSNSVRFCKHRIQMLMDKRLMYNVVSPFEPLVSFTLFWLLQYQYYSNRDHFDYFGVKAVKLCRSSLVILFLYLCMNHVTHNTCPSFIYTDVEYCVGTLDPLLRPWSTCMHLITVPLCSWAGLYFLGRFAHHWSSNLQNCGSYQLMAMWDAT